jgi:hypothetical protein
MMGFSGLWSQHGVPCVDEDNDYILRSLKAFAADTRVFKKEDVENKFFLWLINSRKRIRNEVYEKIKFNPEVDPEQNELRKLVDMLIGGSDDPDELETIRQTAMIAFNTFLFRTKNHIRLKFFNSAHLMIVLSGIQGDCKTWALKHMMGVLNGMSSSVSLKAFQDNSMSYQFSIMPVACFEEMEGAGKADIDTIKALMTDEEKMMVEKYKVAGVRRIISTFIGCSNKDIRSLLRDPTGNRRFIQFVTLLASRAEIAKLDWLKIWQSVDEDADEPPMYASEANLKMVKAMQEDQRVQGDIEQWILETSNLPWGQATNERHLYDLFKLWAENGGLSKATLNYWDKKRFAAEMLELMRSGRFQIRESHRSRSRHWTIQRPSDVAPTEEERRENRAMAGRVAAKEGVARKADDRSWESVELETGGLVKRDAALDKIIRLQPG